MKLYTAMLASVLFVAAGCSGGPFVERAHDRITWFHEVYNGGDLGAVVDQADAMLTETGTREQVLSFLGKVRGKLGKEIASQQQSWGG